MWVLFRAQGEEVAIKQVKDASAMDKAEAALRTLKHENIIRLIGVSRSPTVNAVIMEVGVLRCAVS